MALSPGDQLGPYVVTASIGAGGMGEVYKARDTRLNRDVAIKVSNAKFSERFEREARAIAALNHPHVCTLHDVGPNYLVMEHIEGVPLKGPLPLDKVLAYTAQICDALDAAHRKGIVHRDLKPSNILVTKQGVKVLDFGIATMAGQPTLTKTGAAVGTPAYMSPEQWGGRDADARSDIYSLGCVIHEMATGDRIPHKTLEPPALDRAVKTCIATDPEERWQSAREVKLVLEASLKPASMKTGPLSLKWTAAGLLVGALLGILAWRNTGPAPEAPLRKFTIADENIFNPRISPDGSHVAYASGIGSNPHQLLVYDLRSGERRLLVSHPQANYLNFIFWSSRSEWIHYTSHGKLWRIHPTRGSAVESFPLSAESGSYALEGTWGLDDRSLVVADRSIHRFDALGVLQETLLGTDPSNSAAIYHDPQFIPGGNSQTLLFNKGQNVVALDMETRRQSNVVAGTRASYSPTGHLVFERAGGIWAVAYQLDERKAAGRPFPIAQSGSEPSVATDGTLVYLADRGEGLDQLIYKSRNGSRLGEIGQPQTTIWAPVLSPDGSRVAVCSRETGNADIWIHRVGGGKTRLTLHPSDEDRAVWHPDGQRISYTSNHSLSGGRADIYIQKVDGSNTASLIASETGNKFGYDWSPDGIVLAANLFRPETNGNVYFFRNLGKGVFEGVPFVETPFDEYAPMFSPDGKYIAYTSNESGRYEVYVKALPEGGRSQVSASGGTQPQWRGDGKELFFAAGDSMMAVPVTLTPAFSSGAPVKLFEHKGLIASAGNSTM